MKNLYILFAVFLAMLVMIVYAGDTPIKPIPKECPKKDPVNRTVNIAHESNCSLFYSCQRGRKILLSCAKLNLEGDLLQFNPSLQVCDWPENVKCKNKPKPDEDEGEKEDEEVPEEGEVAEGEEEVVEEEEEEGGENPDEGSIVRDKVIRRLLMNQA